jgi:uncharacterized membrane protein
MRNIFKDIDGLVFVLAFVSALGCGLIAGIFFAFSNFVMKSLTRLPPANGIAAMQAINVDVLNGWFFAAFFGTALCCLVLAVSSFFRWDRPDAIYLLAGSLLYLVGTILVTIIFNVPLNDALAAVDPMTDHAGHLWTTMSEVGPPGITCGRIGARGSGFVYRRALSCKLTIRSHPTQNVATNDAHSVTE